MIQQNNLAATVFVFRNRETLEIRCEYLGAAKMFEQNPDWEHLATLEPRLWIQAHWDEVVA